MKSFVMALSICCLISACDKQEETTCDSYCDMQSSAASQDAINKLCEVSFDAQALYESKCIDSCTEVLDYVVDPEEQEDASKCLMCIVSNTLNPSEKTIRESKEICFKECNGLGGYQFFFSFFVSPPNWDCN